MRRNPKRNRFLQFKLIPCWRFECQTVHGTCSRTHRVTLLFLGYWIWWPNPQSCFFFTTRHSCLFSSLVYSLHCSHDLTVWCSAGFREAVYGRPREYPKSKHVSHLLNSLTINNDIFSFMSATASKTFGGCRRCPRLRYFTFWVSRKHSSAQHHKKHSFLSYHCLGVSYE